MSPWTTTEIQKRTSVTELCNAWRESEEEVVGYFEKSS